MKPSSLKDRLIQIAVNVLSLGGVIVIGYVIQPPQWPMVASLFAWPAAVYGSYFLWRRRSLIVA